MTHRFLLTFSQRWFQTLARLYPPDFRDEMGNAVVEAYMDRASDALKSGGAPRLVAIWARALGDGLRNGPAERVRPAASWRRGGNWGRDLEMVRRRLVRSPLFALTAIATLTVGLGMFAVAYTAVQKIMLDPMPYRNPDDLYYVWRDYGPINEVKRGLLAGTDLTELQKTSGVIEGAVGVQSYLGGIFSVREGGEPMEIAVTQVSPNFFQMLGVPPALGRGFSADEAFLGAGRGHSIILSHHLWRRLGADPAIVGTNVRLQGRPHTVVGVLPRTFTFLRSDATAPPQRVDAYIPLESDPARANPRAAAYAGIIRARHGASPDAVAAAAGAAGRAIDERDFNGRGLKLYPVGVKADVILRIRPALVVLAGAGMVLVLMLMVNLASVLIARAAQREHEIAVSRALGANTAAIVRSTLLEGGFLGLIGGAFGAVAAIWGTSAIVALAPLDLPRREALVVDWRIAAIVIGIGVGLGLCAAAAPSIWAARASLASLLAGSAVRGGGGHGRLRRGMIVTQVALSLVLLTSGALVVRSFQRLLRADPGFRPDGVLTVRMRTPPEFFPQTSDAIDFHDRVTRALAAIPGVEGASAAFSVPLSGSALKIPVSFPGSSGNTGDAERDKTPIDVITVRPNYVEVMGMRLLAGRTFGEARPNGPQEVMIDAAIARRFFPEGNAVGSTLRLADRTCTIIGVVAQARLYDIHSDGRPQVLARNDDWGVRPLFYVIRTGREPRSLLPEVRAAVHKVDPRVPAGDDRTMDEIVDAALSPQSIGAALTAAFAAGALLLAAMGLFGVVSGSVTRRRHELAVRLALGADHPRVLRLVLKDGALLVLTGLLVGAPGVYFANGLIRGLLVGVSVSDPLTLAGAGIGLLVVTLAACYIPARRTLRIDPAQLLRRDC